MLLSLDNISFRYETAADQLFDRISITFHKGWTGVVGANGTGKTTLLRLACGELEPENGIIHRPDRVIYCEQRTDRPPRLLASLILSTDADGCTIKGRLGIGDDWSDRWQTLSHGERKRAQIAAALWQAPVVLAVDEPTNHIDIEAQRMLSKALATFRGIGILVSHDRELLDSLCNRCVVLDPPSVTIRPGGYTKAVAQARMEDDRVRDEYDVAKKAAEKLRRETLRRRQAAERADKKRSKRRLDVHDSDGRRRLDLARLTGRDGRAGRLANQMEGRVEQAQQGLQQFGIKRRYELDFWLPGSCSHKNRLFALPPGSIDIGGRRRLLFPELTMRPDDRIAVTGPNGAGKSTLIRHIMSHLSLPEDRIVYLPQEIDLATSQQVMVEVNGLSGDKLGKVMTIVSCLGSRPERLVGSSNVSPGEIRKILLALGVARAPHVIVMDEPTNHLDLPAIECLEDALDGCPCGLMLVSHDLRFLSRLTRRRWDLTPEGRGVLDFRLWILE